MRRDYGLTAQEIVVSLVILGSIALVGSSFFVGDDKALKAAGAAGYTSMRVTGTHRGSFAQFHGCDREDWKATVINGKNHAGNEVTITVCEGLLFKKATIRH